MICLAIYHPRPERWPQVSLRGVLVTVTLLCVWLGVQVKWIRDRHEAYFGNGVMPNPFSNTDAPWSLRLFGEEGVDMIDVRRDAKFTAERVRVLFPEASVSEVDASSPLNSHAKRP